MKEVVIKINQNGFIGTAKIKIKKFKERLNLVKEFSNEDSNTTSEDMTIRMIDLCEKNVTSIDLKFEDTQIASLDELGYYAEGVLIISEIAKNIIGGLQLKKA